MTGGPVEAFVRALRSAADGLADLALWIKLWSKDLLTKVKQKLHKN